MPATYEPIATTTLGSDASEIAFSTISGTYTDLVLVVANLELVNNGNGLKIRFNSDTGSNYSYTHLYGNGTSAGSGRQSNMTSGQIGWAAVGSSGAKSNVIVSVQNYANSTTNKTVISRFNDSAAETGTLVSLWRNTSAITAISLFASTGNLKSGTRATLYGIKAA